MKIYQDDYFPCFSGGSYCPNGSSVHFLCEYPNYCPPNSTQELECRLGYQALNSTGKRDDHDKHCEICRPGTYGNHPQRLVCDTCPAGFFCPNGTKGPYDNPCPEGAYCPAGSGVAQPCSPGSYGNRSQATAPSDCFPCPKNTFTNLENQTACRPCGSSSFSDEGQPECTCRGKNRYFQVTDGSCDCLAGFVFYGTADKKIEDGNSDLDCQPEVWKHFIDSSCFVIVMFLPRHRTIVSLLKILHFHNSQCIF